VQLAALVVQLIAAWGRRLFVALESWQLMAQDVQRGVWLVATVYPGISLGSVFLSLGCKDITTCCYLFVFGPTPCRMSHKLF
jgi:hypothetical protein